MKKNNSTPSPSTKLSKGNKKRFYSLMVNFLGYIGKEYDAAYSSKEKNDFSSVSSWRIINFLNKCGAKWMFQQKRKDILFLLTLDKLNNLPQYKYGSANHFDLKIINDKWTSFENLSKSINTKFKTKNYPKITSSLVDYMRTNDSDKYLDKNNNFSAENLYRVIIIGSISEACRLTLNKFIHLVIKNSKGLALKKAIECTHASSFTKYEKIILQRAKETSDQRLFGLLCKKLSDEKKSDLFLHLYNGTIEKYNKKPFKLNEASGWWRSDLFPTKLFNLYYHITDKFGAAGFKNCSDQKRNSLSIISEDLGKTLFEMDWDNNKFLLFAKLPYTIQYDIIFSYISNKPNSETKKILSKFLSSIISKREELFVNSILNNPTIKESNQIYFIDYFLDNSDRYTKTITSDILRDCIALYGNDEDFIYFMNHLNQKHKEEFFERAESKWK